MATLKEVTRIVDTLLQGFGEETDRRPTEPGTAFLWTEISDALAPLDLDVYVWTRLLGDYPCVSDDEGPAPVLMNVQLLGQFYQDAETLTQAIRRQVRNFEEFYERKKMQFQLQPVRTVKYELRERLIRFATVRFGEDEAPKPRTATSLGAATSQLGRRRNPYLDLEVHTSEAGLRVHYTPAYFINWSNVFGTPTTPSVGWILPGRYKFAAMRSNGEFMIDIANFDIPPTTAAHLVLR